jgi:hypothetical protein
METFILLSFVGVGLAVILVTSGERRLPLSERAVFTLLRMAAWLERIGAACDSAIVRYRLERMATTICLESTSEREGRRAA